MDIHANRAECAHGCTEQTCRFAVPLVLMLHLTATLSMVAVALSSKGIYELRLQMKDVVVREATSYAGHVLFVLEQLPGAERLVLSRGVRTGGGARGC